MYLHCLNFIEIIFVATEWKNDPVDLYDCRMRPWYVEAAASPKDILILVDNSGSMMGQSKIIARHVINTLLDTLSVNDFVNVLVFSNVTLEVVPCFKELLVQVRNILKYLKKIIFLTFNLQAYVVRFL